MNECHISYAGVYGLIVSLHEGPDWLQVASASQVEALVDDARLVTYLEEHLEEGARTGSMDSMERALLVAEKAGMQRLSALLRRVLAAATEHDFVVTRGDA